MAEGLSHCGELARAGDPERFYAALFAPAAKREALFALLAFNLEIARIREHVSDPIIGEMRLAWWRDVLDEVSAGGRVRAHPVAEALAAAHSTQAFDVAPLQGLIDARSFDLYGEPMADMAALETYAKATGGDLHGTMTASLGGTEAEQAAAKAGGTAFALTGLIRALSIHTSRGQTYLPRRELLAHGSAPEAVLAGETSFGIQSVITSVVGLAREHLTIARANPAHREPAAFATLLPCSLLPAHWRHMNATSFDPFGQQQMPKPEIMFRLLLAAVAKRI